VTRLFRPRRTCLERGQALIEFAFVAPLLLAFIFFMVDCGFLAYSYVSVTNAVREGARCAAVGGSADAVSTRVTDTSGGLVNTITVDAPAYSPNPAAIGGSVTVSAHYTYDWISPAGLIPGLSNFTFDKSAKMRMETDDTTTKTVC
jgi:hypothetical protein